MFEERRAATPQEITRLLASLDVSDPPAVILEAEVSEVATLANLGALHTVVLTVREPRAPRSRYFPIVARGDRRSMKFGSVCPLPKPTMHLLEMVLAR